MSGIACSIIVSGTGLSALTPEAQVDIRSTGKAARVATAIAMPSFVALVIIHTVRKIWTREILPDMGFRHWM